MATVTLAHCNAYNAELPSALEALLEPLGGMRAFVTPGQTVLIKPNMLTHRHPDQAVTTHPELVRAIIRAVKTAGGAPVIGDSPASAVRIDRVMEDTGFVALCREEDVPLMRFEAAGSVPCNQAGFSFNIAKPIRDADVVINVPKIKTHTLTTLTAAIKNTYGAIPGYQKALLHKRYANPQDFGKLLWAIYQAVAPDLHIADGIVGMEGAGPAGGTPVNLAFLAAASDGVAMDLAISRLLGIDPRTVPYLPPSITPPDPVTPALQDTHFNNTPVHARTIALPSTLAARMIPRGLTRLLEPFVWIRPAMNHACTRCGQCIKACPMDALTLPPETSVPELDPARCIGCCCCHEICPAKAITMTQSPLLNLIRRGKLP